MLEIAPVRLPLKTRRFSLSASLARIDLRANDIIVGSSKFVSMSEGRLVRLSRVKPGERAVSLASDSQMDPRLCELVLREADYILAGVPGFLLAIKDGMTPPKS